MKTYNDIYLSLRNALRINNIEAYNLEARILAASAAGKTVSQLLQDLNLYTTPSVEKKAEEYCARRLAGEPVAYITGLWEFYGLPMKVTQDVLIPRMDTEVLIDAAKDLLIGHNMNARVLDLCCGSGCIACAIGHELPGTKLVCVDISDAALEICRENICSNRLNTRAICLQSDVLMPPPASLSQFDLIVSNPPYIATAEIETLDASVRDYEPVWALDGGEDGYKFYKAIIKYWKSLLKPGGSIIFEVGEGQAETVTEMLMSAGFKSAYTRKDTLGVDRVVTGTM